MQKVNTCVKIPTLKYRIGMFAQMNHISIKTLRFYDDIDLLKPAFVDENNGYRYYTSQQMPLLYQIISLKEIGFSIDEIKTLVQGESEKKLLQSKKVELLLMQSQISKQLAKVEYYLSDMQLFDEYHVVLKKLEPICVACMSVKLESYAGLFDVMPKMGALMEKVGCECDEPGYCFTIYEDAEYKENDVNALICEKVNEAKQPIEGLCFQTFDEVQLAACVLHRGSYQSLPKAYCALVQFIEQNGYEINGLAREVYIDGIWNKDSEELWLTEIQFPILKK